MSGILLSHGEELLEVLQISTALCLLLWACSFVIKNAKGKRS